MPAFTLYNAADFRDSVPENVRDEFINALDNYEAARKLSVMCGAIYRFTAG